MKNFLIEKLYIYTKYEKIIHIWIACHIVSSNVSLVNLPKMNSKFTKDENDLFDIMAVVGN